MKITSRSTMFYGIEILLLITLLPITQCFPSIIRWFLQISSLLLFLAGMLLERNKKYLLGYLLCVLFGVTYVYSVWNFNQSIVTCIFNVMACFAFAFYGIMTITQNPIDIECQRKVVITTIVLLTITAITTVIGLQRYPLAVRELGRVGSGYSSSGQAFLDLKFAYKLMNIASWSIVYGLVFTVPWFINQFRDTKKLKYIIGLSIVLFCLLKAQLTIGIIIAGLLIVFSLFQPSLKAKDVFISVLILTLGIFMILFSNEILLFIVSISGNKNLGMISDKLQDLVYLLQGNQTGDILARFERYTRSLSLFFEHPLTGLSIYGVPSYGLFGNHSDFFDMLGYYGLFGVIVLTVMITKYLRVIHYSSVILDKWRVIVPFVALLMLFILNPLWYSPQVFATAIMLPCCAYVRLDSMY